MFAAVRAMGNTRRPRSSKVGGVRSGPRTHSWRVVFAAAICAGVLAGAVSPSWAAPAETAGGGSTVDGAFPLGGGAEASVDARSGALEITTPLSIIGLGWESRGSGVNRFGLGNGWRLADVGFIDTRGGVRVFPARSVPGAFVADDSVPSGLAGYPADDVRFSESPGILPGRPDGLVGERSYAFVLREVGGLVAYFDAAGDPVARVDAHGARMDWIWSGGHRLRRTVSGSGVVTELDWADSSRVQIGVRVGAGPARPAGVIELSGGRVTRVTDATGARTSVGYTPGGLVSQIATASGARTQVTWRLLDDGSPAAGEVLVVDARTGERVTERRWEPRSALASGWPTGAAAGSPGGPPFATLATDGLTRLDSTYSSGQALITRDTIVSSPSGDRTVKSEVFDVEAGAHGTGPARPTGMALTYLDEKGASRTLSEEYAFDGLGRITVRTAADGTVTRTAYDEVIPPVDGVPVERLVPIGLPVLERTEAPDGSVTETRHTLNAARTAVVASETFEAVAGTPLTRTGRHEFDVGADGFVVAQREYPQGGEGVPLTTERERRTDPAAGTVSVAETVAAGTPVRAADGTRYAYNARNQPVRERTPAGEVVHTSYWASGDRSTLATSGDPSAVAHATTFYWDDGTLHSEVHERPGTEQTASYLLGASREARVLDGAAETTVTYATHDRHGSTTELTDRSGAGVAQYAYRDYGAPLTRAAGPAGRSPHEAARYPFLFAGEYTNPSGTQHLAARTYAPEQLSFTSADPTPLHNRYAYADANPIMRVDPSGHFATGDLLNGLVIGLGVLFSLIGAATLGASAPAVPMTLASLMGAIGANAPSVIVAGIGVLADVGGSAIATVRFIHDHGVAFLDAETDHRLEVAEYVLLGAGAAGAAGGLIAARVESSRRLGIEIAHEQALLADGNVAATYFRQEGARLQRIFDSVTFQALERQSVSTTVTAFKQAALRLEHIERSYLFTAKSSWHGASPTHEQTMEFLIAHGDLVGSLDTEITNIQTAAEREIAETWKETSEWKTFNDAFLPAKEDVVLSTIDVLVAARTGGR